MALRTNLHEHSDDDAKETAQFGHKRILHRVPRCHFSALARTRITAEPEAIARPNHRLLFSCGRPAAAILLLQMRKPEAIQEPGQACPVDWNFLCQFGRAAIDLLVRSDYKFAFGS